MEEITITRPKLAALLMEAGEVGHRTVNPFKPHLSAWVFPLTERAACLIDGYYSDLGKPAPRKVREWKKGGEQNGEV